MSYIGTAVAVAAAESDVASAAYDTISVAVDAEWTDWIDGCCTSENAV